MQVSKKTAKLLKEQELAFLKSKRKEAIKYHNSAIALLKIINQDCCFGLGAVKLNMTNPAKLNVKQSEDYTKYLITSIRELNESVHELDRVSLPNEIVKATPKEHLEYLAKLKLTEKERNSRRRETNRKIALAGKSKKKSRSGAGWLTRYIVKRVFRKLFF